MKQAIALSTLIVLFALSSCGGAEKAIQRDLNKVYIGMTIPEFQKNMKRISLVYLSEDYTCYKLTRRREKFGEPGGTVYATRFFYFQGEKLWKIDEGER